jgi:hypothetical protein
MFQSNVATCSELTTPFDVTFTDGHGGVQVTFISGRAGAAVSARDVSASLRVTLGTAVRRAPPKLHGQQNSAARLTNEQASQIRERYVPRKVSTRCVANAYEGSRATMFNVIRKATWRATDGHYRQR